MRDHNEIEITADAQTALTARPWQLIRTIGLRQIVVVDKAQERNETIYNDAINELCGGKSPCKVSFWSNAKLTPSSYPMTDAQFAGMKAVYEYDQTTNSRSLLWSCEIVNDPARCFRPPF